MKNENDFFEIGSSVDFDVNQYTSEAPEFRVAADHPDLKAENGVLFSKDGKKLLRFPTGRCPSHYRVPDSVEELGDYAFSHCEAESLDLNHVHRAGWYAIVSCPNLRDLNLGTKLETVSQMMLYSCHELYHLELPSSVRSIEDISIARCTNLKELTIPRTVERMGRSPFGHYVGTTVTLEGSGAVLYVKEQYIDMSPERPMNFLRYDAGFFRSLPEIKGIVAFLRLTHPVELSEKKKLEYNSYLLRNGRELAQRFIAGENLAGIRQMRELGFINDENIDLIIDDSGVAGQTAVTAYLLEEKHRTAADPADLFTL